MGIKQNVMNALASDPIRWVNFTFANHMICPMTFYLLATTIASGRVKCKTDANLTDRAEYHPDKDTIFAQDDSVGETYWDDKSMLVHECAHAILDCIYAGRNMNGAATTMKILTDETIGYLAGAIYLQAAQPGGNPSNSGPGDPLFEALKAVRPKVRALMAKPWSGCDTMDFTAPDVAALQSAIKKHKFYNSTWNQTAIHDGMKRPGPAPGYAQ